MFWLVFVLQTSLSPLPGTAGSFPSKTCSVSVRLERNLFLLKFHTSTKQYFQGKVIGQFQKPSEVSYRKCVKVGEQNLPCCVSQSQDVRPVTDDTNDSFCLY